MTELLIQIQPAEGHSVADLARALLWGPHSRWLLPARAVQGPDDGVGQERQDASGFTTFEGPSLAPMVVQAAQEHRGAEFVCALCIALPGPQGLQPAVYLRGPTAVPLCALQIQEDRLCLHFGAQPLFAGPEPHYDWPEAVAQFRDQLGATLGELSQAGAEIALHGDLRPGTLDYLAKGLGVTAAPPAVLKCQPSQTPGRCRQCRHANQGTIDLTEDGLLACTFAGSKFGQSEPVCDVKLKPAGYAYEPWDGANCTWGAGVRLDFGEPSA